MEELGTPSLAPKKKKKEQATTTSSSSSGAKVDDCGVGEMNHPPPPGKKSSAKKKKNQTALDILAATTLSSNNNDNKEKEEGEAGSSSSNTPVKQDGASNNDNNSSQVTVNTQSSKKGEKRPWTDEEDLALTNVVKQNGERSWKQIASQLTALGHGFRSDTQCLHRWQKVIKPDLQKGPWSPEEDELLRKLVEELGAKEWSKISKRLGGRIGKQARERWHNHLNPGIKNKEPWSDEENRVILTIMCERGPKWAEMSRQLPGRTDNSIKNHYNSAIKKIWDAVEAEYQAMDASRKIDVTIAKMITKRQSVGFSVASEKKKQSAEKKLRKQKLKQLQCNEMAEELDSTSVTKKKKKELPSPGFFTMPWVVGEKAKAKVINEVFSPLGEEAWHANTPSQYLGGGINGVIGGMFSPLPAPNSANNPVRSLYWSMNRDDDSPLHSRSNVAGRPTNVARSFQTGETNSMFHPPSVNRTTPFALSTPLVLSPITPFHLSEHSKKRLRSSPGNNLSPFKENESPDNSRSAKSSKSMLRADVFDTEE